MLLHDHFRAPLSEQRPWESFHATWCSSLADYLNDDLLPPGYIALERVHRGPGIEIDVATFSNGAPAGERVETGTTTLANTIWTPATAPLTFAAEFSDRLTVEVHSTEGGRTLAAAIELVSPGNKHRHSKRRLFAAKCAAYLAQGVGLIVVDAVSTRRAHMHHELVDLLNLGKKLYMADSPHLYAVG